MPAIIVSTATPGRARPLVRETASGRILLVDPDVLLNLLNLAMYPPP